ncbi:putative GNAT family acetyltransferase [Kribbella rubisoli]|uniref:GNAT family acetyltransferase n=1 Tax=Kribbella rubisoli TaxID=3075929 RepID=A0A4Q7X6G1_9ACTN|nr:GNAT family N-acetyltransferase [Kribbella rubisoli]RZU18690.1 putative GNAT family acetyltransferase [Kribbella rubisoli]
MDDAELVRAIEDNAAELLMAMGAAGGGEQRDDAVARWTIGGSPIDYHNAVVAASDVRAVADSLALLKKHGVPGNWHVGPSMKISRDTILAGFAAAGSEPGMAVRIDELVPAEVPGLSLTRVGDDDALAVWEATLGQGFGEGEREARWVASVYQKLGYDDPWQHYIGRLDGAPVGTATVFLGAGVAGLYFVMTVPEVRRRGIGAAITYGALRDAGTEYAVLESSPAGRSVYERLGFREYCTIELYEWAPTG